MNLQQKALAIVIPLVVLLSAGYSYYMYQIKSGQVDQFIEISERQLHQQYEHMRELMVEERYHYELRQLLTDRDMINAIRDSDREALLAQVTPYWELIQEENPHVQRLHFHRADGVSLLRVHKPEKNGDTIAEVRPVLQQLHKQRQPMDFVEMGKNGLFYRVMEPIFDSDGTYLGGVEMGISVHYLLHSMKHMTGMAGVVLVDKKVFQVLENPARPVYTVGKFSLWGGTEEEVDWLGHISEGFSDQSHLLIKTEGGESYLLHILALPVLPGAPEAVAVVAHDLTMEISEKTLFIKATLVVTLAVIILIFFTLRFTLTPLLKSLLVVNDQLSDTLDKVTLLSVTDPLTQIYNRQKFNEVLGREISKATRYQLPLALIMIDIDHFKEINDKSGHLVGDVVLKESAGLIGSNLRSSDLFARWGGEEFAIILPHQSLVAATQIAEKLRSSVESNRFDTAGRVTISCGVTQLQQEEAPAELLKRLDANLYKAKKEGRNRVVAA